MILNEHLGVHRRCARFVPEKKMGKVTVPFSVWKINGRYMYCAHVFPDELRASSFLPMGSHTKPADFVGTKDVRVFRCNLGYLPTCTFGGDTGLNGH